MAMMRRSFSVTVYLRDADGHGWHKLQIFGRIIQGNLEGQPGFCMVIAMMLHEVVNDPRVSRWRRRVRHWLYVDDWIMQVPQEVMHLLLDVALRAAAKYNFQLQLRK